jgi:hypothetical protein
LCQKKVSHRRRAALLTIRLLAERTSCAFRPKLRAQQSLQRIQLLCRRRPRHSNRSSRRVSQSSFLKSCIVSIILAVRCKIVSIVVPRCCDVENNLKGDPSNGEHIWPASSQQSGLMHDVAGRSIQL